MTEPIVFGRPFVLQRDHDVSGVSGVGIVAYGVLWPDETVSIRWRGERPSTVFWNSLDDAISVHGHGGSTHIVWADDEHRQALEQLGREQAAVGRAYLLADRWLTANGASQFLVRVAGAELRDTLDASADGPGLAAAECSAQYHPRDPLLERPPECIRAARHHGDHIDEDGFHWFDTVAVYPVAEPEPEHGHSAGRLSNCSNPDHACVEAAIQRAIAADLRVENRALRQRLALAEATLREDTEAESAAAAAGSYADRAETAETALAEAQQVISLQKDLIGGMRRIVRAAMHDREDDGVRVERCRRCGMDHMADLETEIREADKAYAEAFAATADGPARPGRLPDGAHRTPRQHAYEAVRAYIHSLGDSLPSTRAARTAHIWQAVNRALEAAGHGGPLVLSQEKETRP